MELMEAADPWFQTSMMMRMPMTTRGREMRDDTIPLMTYLVTT